MGFVVRCRRAFSLVRLGLVWRKTCARNLCSGRFLVSAVWNLT